MQPKTCLARNLKILISSCLSILIFFACKKVWNENDDHLEKKQQKVALYMQHILETASLENKKQVENLLQDFDFRMGVEFKQRGASSLVYDLSKYDFKEPPHKVSSDEAQKILTKIVFDFNSKGDVTTGTIIRIKENGQTTVDQNELLNILTCKSKTFSGSMYINSLLNINILGVVFNTGKLTTIAERKSIVGQTAKKIVNNNGYHTNDNESGCTDWYWVTTYHFQDGSSYSEEIYLNTTCDEAFGPNTDQSNNLTTPCDKIKILKNDTAFVSLMKILKSKVGDFSETSYLVRRGTSTNFELMPTVPGSVGGVSMSVSSISPNIDGIMHNHTTGLLSIFSPSDIQSMAIIFDSSKMNNLLDFSMTVITGASTAYVLTVANANQFNTFKTTYLSSNTGMNIFETLYGLTYQITTGTTSADNETHFLQLLKMTGSGLQLTSVDFSTFSNWDVKTLNENNTIKSIPCKD